VSNPIYNARGVRRWRLNGKKTMAMRADPVLGTSLLLILLVVFGCDRSDQANVGDQSLPAPATPILVFAVDGLEWDVMLPLLKAGKLPNFADLMERGCYGELETFVPTFSPVVWTTVATGKVLSKHGIRHFARPSKTGEKLRLYNSGDRKTKAIWNIASDYGRDISCIGWWMTHPVEKVNGIMVAQTNTIDQLNTGAGKHIWKGMLRETVLDQVFPSNLQGHVLSILRDAEKRLPGLTRRIFGAFRHPLTLLDQRLWANCQWAFRADATYLEIGLDLIRKKPNTDLTLIYFGGPDVVGHRFWRYREPEIYRHMPTAEQVEDLGSIIDDYYMYTDEALGQLLEVCPADVTVLVISDHGMKPVNQAAQFDPNHPPRAVNSGDHQDGPPGVIFVAGPCVRRSSSPRPLSELERADLDRIGSVLDITPTILAMMRIPLAADMDGKVLTQLFREDFEVEQQPAPLSTHDTRQFLARRGVTAPRHPGEAERIRQLKSLGYIGDDLQDVELEGE
jgi:predicted AlkP superfamily pyrophosphatase or phosphodiesterase